MWRRFISPATSAISSSVVNGLNAYVYANNNPIGIAAGGLCIGSNVDGSTVGSVGGGKMGSGNSVANKNNGFAVTIPAIDGITVAIDFAASMSGALSVIRWTKNNPTFYEDLLTYGVQKHQMLFGLKTPLSAVSYLLVAYDVGVDVWSHIQAGDSWKTTTASGLVTAGVGTFNIWVSAQTGAAVGGMIGGIPGFLIGLAAGIVVGVVIHGIFHTEINGKSIAGYIEDGIEYILEALF